MQQQLIRLTAAMVSMIGGQMAFYDKAADTTIRGELSDATVEDGTLKAKLIWAGQGQGISPSSWTKTDASLYHTHALDTCTIENIGPNEVVGGSDCWKLTSEMLGYTITMYPADSEKLDPADVNDLQLATSSMQTAGAQNDTESDVVATT